MNTATLVTGFIASLALGAIVASMTLIPALSRPTVPLGVSVPADRVHDPVVRAAVRRYRLICLVAGALAAGGLFATIAHPASIIAWSLGYLAVATAAFALCRRVIVAAKRAGGWYAGHRVGVSAPVTPDAAHGVGPVWWLHLLALLSAFAAATVVAASYDRLPDPLPVHWDAGGVVDRWEAKTWASVLTMPAFSVLMVVSVAALCAWLGRRVDPLLPDGDSARARVAQTRRQHVMQVALGWVNVATALLFVLLNLNLVWALPAAAFSAMMVAGVVIVFLPIVWMLIASARSGSKAATPSGGLDSPDDDAHWPLGLVYVNPDDPRLNVPKRSGLGYTINLAHPAGRVLSVLLIVLLVVSAALPFVLTR